MIRPATDSDLEAITAIYNDAIVNTVATFDIEPQTVADRAEWLAGLGPRHPVLIAAEDDEVVGWASLTGYSPRPAYADTATVSVYVRKDCRGRGIGAELMVAIIEAGRETGLHVVLARIADANPTSIRLHESVGFEHVGVLREAGLKFGRRLDVHVMQLIYPSDTP